jgi:hypothetical protein
MEFWNLTLRDRADQLVALLSTFVFSPEGFQQLRACTLMRFSGRGIDLVDESDKPKYVILLLR